MRISDIERQRAVEELRRHCAAGRLDVDEYAVRIEQVLSATTFEEIDRVLADLPMVRIADPAGSTAARRPGEAGSAPPSTRNNRFTARLAATSVVVLTVVVVVAAVTLATLASWAWAAVLVIGWLLGLAQARLARRRL
jgi:hypothetical protein